MIEFMEVHNGIDCFIEIDDSDVNVGIIRKQQEYNATGDDEEHWHFISDDEIRMFTCYQLRLISKKLSELNMHNK